MDYTLPYSYPIVVMDSKRIVCPKKKKKIHNIKERKNEYSKTKIEKDVVAVTRNSRILLFIWIYYNLWKNHAIRQYTITIHYSYVKLLSKIIFKYIIIRRRSRTTSTC